MTGVARTRHDTGKGVRPRTAKALLRSLCAPDTLGPACPATRTTCTTSSQRSWEVRVAATPWAAPVAPHPPRPPRLTHLCVSAEPPVVVTNDECSWPELSRVLAAGEFDAGGGAALPELRGLHSHLSSLSRFASSVIISPGPGTPHVAGDIGACGQHVVGAASSPQPDNSLLDTQACAGPCWRSVRTCPSWECVSATRRWRQCMAARWSGPQSLCTGACLLSCTTATPCLRTSRQGRPTRCACVACLKLHWMTDRLVEMDGAHRL